MVAQKVRFEDMKVQDIREAVFSRYQEKEAKRTQRKHALGASQIGRPCSREIWYGFRLCTKSSFPGRILRLFRRGFEAEPQFVEELNDIGLTVKSHNDDGKQFRVSTHKGHCACNFDGVVQGITDEGIDASDFGLAEFKTHNDKSFKGLKKGVRLSKEEHYAQMQLSMGLAGFKFAVYEAENKNDSDIHVELVRLDTGAYERFEERAKMIIFSTTPPEKISDKPDWYQCKCCDAYSVCKEEKIPLVNCCTCIHSTPVDGGKWSCKLGGVIPDAVLLEGCPEHLFIPNLLPFEVIDGDDGWIKYSKGDKTIWNVAASGFSKFGDGDLTYSSIDLFELGGE